MEDELSRFYEMRLRMRGIPEATAIVDRCISMIVRAQSASPEAFEAIEAEVEALRAELIARFGPKAPH